MNLVKLKLVIESGKHINFIHLMYKQTVLNPRTNLALIPLLGILGRLRQRKREKGKINKKNLNAQVQEFPNGSAS